MKAGTYYARNRAKELARVRRYRLQNPEKIRAYKKRWRDKNKEKMAEYNARGYRRRRRPGIKCYDCPKPPAPGRARCETHLERHRRQERGTRRNKV